MITGINDMVSSIQQHPRSKMMMVHLDRLPPYLEATPEQS
jgi:hypothetical protein